ncbi:nucleotidyltransferase family protein [Propionicicella superfundia]|uniref:nucleotidyltransferase family protein n=1 Tax=Propionicicella superfundia TaxID=348582 RepID=UPI0004104C87|nr:nucleotidyltransferase family protein [Propionicicella superfundia]
MTAIRPQTATRQRHRPRGGDNGVPPLRPLAGLLVEAVRGVTSAALGEEVAREPSESVVAAGRMHRVGPALHRRVKDAAGRPADWAAPLAAQRHLQLMRHMQAGADLRLVYEVLAGAAVTCVVGKGPVAADLVWPAPDMREYYDVDLFVDRRDFARALDLLLAAGCVLADRNWPEILRTGRAEIALRGPAGTHIDLHWDIAVTPKLRRAFRIDLPAMLGRSREAVLGSGARVRVFDPVDTVLHLVFHAAQAGAGRLMWIGDVHYAAAAPGFEWTEFAARARGARFETPAALVLARVDRCLGFAHRPPDGVLAAGLWGRLAHRRDARGAFPGLPGDRATGGRLYSSARRTVVASSREALVEAYQVRAIERRVAAEGPEERVLYRDVPDPAAREAYLAAVSDRESGL